MGNRDATPVEAATYVAAVAMSLAACLDEPCGCGGPDCLDDVLQHPAVRDRLLRVLGTLLEPATTADRLVAHLTGTALSVDQPAEAWATLTRKAVAKLHGEDTEAEVARREQLATVWALVKAAGGRVELTPRQVLEATEDDRLVTTWRDPVRDVLILEATAPPPVVEHRP